MMFKSLYFGKTGIVLLALMLWSSTVRAQTMTYTSSAATQITEGCIPGSTNTPVLRVEIVTKGSATPLSVLQLVFNTKGTTSHNNITSAKVFYTDTGSSFSAARLFGNAVVRPNGTFAIKGSQTLSGGTNYFWLAYDVSPDATAGNVLDAGFVSSALGVQDYKQVWSDEFNDNAINTGNWNFEHGFVRNNEQQWYQAENATVANGLLTIEARRERKPNPNYKEGSNNWKTNRPQIDYTATSMHTSGRQEWQYGRFEMRAKIDTNAGCWPAWWTLGVAGNWPSNGEIDIMEYYREKILANIAVGTGTPYKALWFGETKAISSFSDPAWADAFHVWRMDWDYDGISIYVDDLLLNHQPQSNLYNRDSKKFYPFRQKHYMLLNFAIGGDNGGNPANTAFPRTFRVDYVRVAQKIEGRFTLLGIKKPVTQAPAGAVVIKDNRQ